MHGGLINKIPIYIAVRTQARMQGKLYIPPKFRFFMLSRSEGDE